MGAVILFAALSLVLSVLTPMVAPLLAQTPLVLPPSGPLATFAPTLIRREAAMLPTAPVPAADIVATPATSFIALCPTSSAPKNSSEAAAAESVRKSPCAKTQDPYAPFLNTTAPAPLTSGQKAALAFHNFKDPGNLISVAYTAAFTIATDSHTAYGPGWKGFGENTSYRLVRDATGEFIGTYLIPSLTHQDPRYHRMPEASVPRRILHAASHTVIAQSDTGAHMPNYATLLGTPVRAEIANLYIPGVQCNLPATAERVFPSLAEKPADDLITEFLPDVARHVHIHVRFAQHMIDEATGNH